MLAARRSAALRPALARHCSFLNKMAAMEKDTTALAAKLPDNLKGIAESGVSAAPERINSRWHQLGTA